MSVRQRVIAPPIIRNAARGTLFGPAITFKPRAAPPTGTLPTSPRGDAFKAARDKAISLQRLTDLRNLLARQARVKNPMQIDDAALKRQLTYFLEKKYAQGIDAMTLIVEVFTISRDDMMPAGRADVAEAAQAVATQWLEALLKRMTPEQQAAAVRLPLPN